MRLFYAGLLTTLIGFSTHCVIALRLDIYGHRNRPISHISKRGVGTRVTSSELNNTADVSYYVDLTLGGKSYQLLLDTGSSDLWIAGNVPQSKTTPFSSAVHYAVGGVEGIILVEITNGHLTQRVMTGPVKTAELQFVGHTIPDQAFLSITPDAVNKDGDGILGLGPNIGSNIYRVVGSVAGAAVVDRIFLQNETTPNYITIFLGRSKDPTDSNNGSITVGEILQGFENVVTQPKLEVTTALPSQRDQHFQLLLDEDGLIGPDGESIPTHTKVASTSNARQATAVLDTGFSFPQLPKALSAAIYSRFHGAELTNIPSIGQIWTLPCKQEVNITFKFGGKRFPIHPLDATLLPHTVGLPSIFNSKGQESCLGTFQPISYNTGTRPSYDMVLGMAFLRNVYVLMDYGDFIVDSSDRSAPYIQLLPLTDPAEAHMDFVQIRLNGNDTTGDQGLLEGHSSRHTISYIIAIVVVLAILASVVGFLLYRAGRGRHLETQQSDAPPLQQHPANPEMCSTQGAQCVTAPPASYHPHTSDPPAGYQPPPYIQYPPTYVNHPPCPNQC